MTDKPKTSFNDAYRAINEARSKEIPIVTVTRYDLREIWGELPDNLEGSDEGMLTLYPDGRIVVED